MPILGKEALLGGGAKGISLGLAEEPALPPGRLPPLTPQAEVGKIRGRVTLERQRSRGVARPKPRAARGTTEAPGGSPPAR